MRVAVLGLGAMGSAVAGRLLDGGQSLRVWNRTPSRADGLVGRGAERATSIAGAVRDAEAVFVSLTDDAAVRAVVMGEDGAAGALGPDAVLVDMSTVSPDCSRALAAAVGGRFVDAPILGAPQAVAGGEATILLGGESGVLDRIAPAVTAISERQLRCGPVGSSSTMKIVANFLLVGQVAVLAEAVATAQANGIPDELIAVLGRGPLVPPALNNRLDDLIGGDHELWWTARLGRKDLGLARDLAAKAGLDLSLAATVDTMLGRVIDAGLGGKDITAMIEAVRAHRAAAGV